MKQGTEIKTWEDICEVVKIDPIKSVAWAEQLEPEDKAAQLANFKLTKLSKALWGNETPDFKKGMQAKWFPVFYGNNKDKQSAFGFSLSYSIFDDTRTFTGARLSYPSKALSNHAGLQFEDLYRDMMVISGE